MNADAHHKPNKVEGVWYFPIDAHLEQQAQQYGELRKKEGRLFTDQQVAAMPDLHPNHRLASEFRIRKHSMNRLLKCLRKKSPKNILEIGCGNGWLLANITRRLGIAGTGVDIFGEELEQAARLFDGPHIDWIRGDIFKPILPPASFDAVVIASAAQYFNNLNRLIGRAQDFLKTDGCLHIIDTPFYQKKSLKKATTRTFDYYESVGMPWMTGQYFHHSYSDLNGHNFRILHKPTAIGIRLRQITNQPVLPFPHIQIRKTP